MSPIEERPHDLLAQAGVELVETGKLDARYNACYHQATRTIIVRTGLDPATRTCAIGHELGHAANGDDCSNSRAERLADDGIVARLDDRGEKRRGVGPRLGGAQRPAFVSA